MRCYANETMTCVDRYTDKYLQINGIAFQYAIYRDGLGDRLYLTVSWVQDTDTLFQDVLQCRAGTGVYDFTEMEGWEDPVCVMPYLTDSKETALYALLPKNGQGTLRYNLEECEELALYPGVYTTLPQIDVENMIMAANYTHTLRWTLTAGDDRRGWVVNLDLLYREPGADTYSTTAIFTDSFHIYCRLTTPADILGKEACFMLEYRTYGDDWDDNNKESFVTLNRIVTPWTPVERDALIPLQPGEIDVSMLLAGGRVTVQWSAVTDPLNTISAYRLERALAGTDEVPVNFVQLYKGTSTQFRDTLPSYAGTVIYRVCAVNRAETESPFTETGTLDVAQSNLYVSRGGTWVRAAGIWIGEKRASPMARVK